MKILVHLGLFFFVGVILLIVFPSHTALVMPSTANVKISVDEIHHLIKKATQGTPESIKNQIKNILLNSIVGQITTSRVFASAIKYGFEKILGKPKEQGIKREDLVAYYDRLSDELNELKDEIQSIHRDILKLGVVAGYAKSESAIKSNLNLLRRHLRHPDDEHIRNEFYTKAAGLSKHVENIIDGMLGRNAFNADIMTSMQKANQVNLIIYSLPFVDS